MKITDPYALKPTMDASGKPWVQRCFICSRTVDFKKMQSLVEYIKVGDLVRHKKCKPQSFVNKEKTK
jgi:hypothetical protein